MKVLDGNSRVQEKVHAHSVLRGNYISISTMVFMCTCQLRYGVLVGWLTNSVGLSVVGDV